MPQFNGHLPASIDTETSGLAPYFHEIIQIAIQPLDGELRPHPTIKPFVEYIRPGNPERFTPEALAVNNLTIEFLMDVGRDADDVADDLDAWFAQLNLPAGRKLNPIAHNWSFECGFLDAWLGAENRERLFHYHVRDTMPVCGYLRDRGVAGFADAPSISLAKLCERFGIVNERPHDALGDALACAELYRRLCME